MAGEVLDNYPSLQFSAADEGSLNQIDKVLTTLRSMRPFILSAGVEKWNATVEIMQSLAAAARALQHHTSLEPLEPHDGKVVAFQDKHIDSILTLRAFAAKFGVLKREILPAQFAGVDVFLENTRR